MGPSAASSAVAVSSSSEITEQQLFHALDQQKVFRLGEFYLKSGQMTPIYIDLRQIISHPVTLRLTAQYLVQIIRAKNLQFDYIVGVPYAALPLATLVCDIMNVPMLMKRKEAKSYGTKKLIEGVYTTPGKCLLIEDVVVSGESIGETAVAMREEGLEVTDAVAVLDRQQGATSGLAKLNVNFHSALTMEKILDGMISVGELEASKKQEIAEVLNIVF